MAKFLNPYRDEDHRMNLIVKRLVKWMKGETAPPYQINLYFTKKCNLGCKFCYYSGVDGPIEYSNELSKEDLIKLATEGCDFGIDSWYMAGGEPFTRPDELLAMMTIIKQKGKFGNLNTNGTLLTKEIIHKLVEIEWDEITFSIDSAEPKIHDFLRGGKKTFEKCIENIKFLKKTRDSQNKVSPALEMHSVITNLNFNKLHKIVRLASKLGVESVNFTHLMQDTNLAKNFNLDKAQIIQFKKEAEKSFLLGKKLGIFTNLDNYIESKLNDNVGEYLGILKTTSVKKDKKNILSAICFEPWTQMSIFSDGTVGLCGVWNPKIKKYNIKNKSFDECWNGKFFNEIRNKLIKQESQLDECHDCASSRILKNELIKNKVREFKFS